MRVEGHDNIWGIGDCAANVEEDGTPVPPNAQAATQEGRAVARNVLAAIDGGEVEPFDYKPLGQLVEMGSEFAVNEVLKFSGRMAAMFWRMTYLYKLESPRAGRASRLTGSSGSSTTQQPRSEQGVAADAS